MRSKDTEKFGDEESAHGEIPKASEVPQSTGTIRVVQSI